VTARNSRFTRLVGTAIVVGFVFAIASTIWFFKYREQLRSQTSSNQQSSLFSTLKEVLPESLPEPFVELTIPYLRNRTYTSTLGELQKHSETDEYTAYVTNYESDGLTVNGLLTIPKKTALETTSVKEGSALKHPAIIFVHGYIPPPQYETTDNYEAYVDYLARSGFVVFKIDLRGHGDSEGEATGAYYSSDYIVDTLNARAALQTTDFVDPTAIGFWGHSMAGNVLLRTAVVKPEIPAVVIWAGAVYTYADMQEFGIDDTSYRPPSQQTERRRRREELRAAHGDFAADSPFWQRVVATNYLADLKAAIQLHHAVDDTVVNIEYSRNLAQLLEAASIPHELYEYESGGHNLTGTSFSQAMARTVTFFKAYLQNEGS
jgi:uncharacterized protein